MSEHHPLPFPFFFSSVRHLWVFRDGSGRWGEKCVGDGWGLQVHCNGSGLPTDFCSSSCGRLPHMSNKKLKTNKRHWIWNISQIKHYRTQVLRYARQTHLESWIISPQRDVPSHAAYCNCDLFLGTAHCRFSSLQGLSKPSGSSWQPDHHINPFRKQRNVPAEAQITTVS